MTLLEKKLNSEAENEPYKIKRNIFLKSGFKTTKEVAERHEEWSKEAIESRQGKLANVACDIWRFK